MQGQSYRITTSTLGIIVVDECHVAITIKPGTIVTVMHTMNGNRLAEVMWEGRITFIFTNELRQRGELVEDKETFADVS